MASADLVKDFLEQLDPEEVPREFISAATITDQSGQEIMLKGEKLNMLMSNHPDFAFVKDARIFINIQKVVKAINLEVDYIFEMVDLMMSDESAKH